MSETEHDAEVANAQSLVNEIWERLEVISHERAMIGGLLDDLAVYLPRQVRHAALNPNHRNDGFIRA